MKRRASETFHGRRGGGWVEQDMSAGKQLADLHRDRLKAIGVDQWPQASIDTWRRIAAAAARNEAAGLVLTTVEHRARAVVDAADARAEHLRLHPEDAHPKTRQRKAASRG